MNKPRYLLLFVLIISWSIALGQNDLTGAQILRSVRAIYDQGLLHEIPDRLEKAIKNQSAGRFSQSEKVEAFKILILTYIYLEEPRKADEKMIELLKTDHFFETIESDPIEFRSLYETFRNDPIFRIGFKGGINRTFVDVIKLHYIAAEGAQHGVYSTNAGLQGGLSFEKHFTNQWLFNPEFFVSTGIINYTNDSIFHQDPSGIEGESERKSFMTHKITQTRLQLNAFVQYIIGENELNRKFTPFLFGGPSVAYLTNSTFIGDLALFSRDNVTGDEINNTDHYHPLNLSLTAGIGARYKIGPIYISGDVRYQYGVMNLVKEKERYLLNTPSRQKLLNQYLYINNDFSIHQAVFNFGLVIPVFNPKKND